VFSLTEMIMSVGYYKWHVAPGTGPFIYRERFK
jgi:hypothetical protein